MPATVVDTDPSAASRLEGSDDDTSPCSEARHGEQQGSEKPARSTRPVGGRTRPIGIATDDVTTRNQRIFLMAIHKEY